MPFVKISYRSPIERLTAERLANILPSLVASALDCDHPDGRLLATDVEIEVCPMSPGFRTKYDLHIDVEANDYPERNANLTIRRVAITRLVRGFLEGAGAYRPGKAWIWVKLIPASWGEI